MRLKIFLFFVSGKWIQSFSTPGMWKIICKVSDAFNLEGSGRY